MDTPPETRRDPVVETLHGEEIKDPYRWLEDDGEAVQEWTDAQNEYADAHLETDTREALRPRIEPLAQVESYSTITARGGRYFQRVEHETDEHPRLTVRESLDDERRELVDPNEWDETRSMDWYTVDDDGEYIAYGVAEGGDEQYDVYVLEVETGEAGLAVEGTGRTGAGMFAWDPDGEGFYYVATGGPEGGAQMQKEIRHRTLDGDEQVIETHEDPHAWPVLMAHDDSGLVFLMDSEMSGGTDLYLLDEDGTDLVLPGGEAQFMPFPHRGRVYFYTDHGASNYRVLACSLDRVREGQIDPDDLSVVVPERDAKLDRPSIAGDYLVLQYQVDAHSRLSVTDLEGEEEREVALPEYASVMGLAGTRDASEAFFSVRSFDRPPEVHRLDPATAETSVLDRVDVDVPDDIVVEQEWVDSTDDAEVPVFVVRREAVELDGSNPCLLYGYGGFRQSMTPSFGRFRVPFLEDGGVYAQVCARGGQEFGEEWHEAGMLANKQHTFDDFVAAGEALVERGYTSTDRLAVAGGSNGGLSVGAVLTQRPDLWAAAFCAVPLLDMLRFHRFLLGESWTTEYGTPEDPEAFEWLREYSPYHNVDPGREYPPTLFKTAVGDTRVHPSHARKMAARMQAEAAGGPFLLRTEDETGHGLGKPTSMIVEEQLDRWTFLYDRLGLEA